MQIGLDFDNTIVCYDETFRKAAVELGLVPEEFATSKTAIRNHLRAAGSEHSWTELQGAIYGPRMMDAVPFPGVTEFLSACREDGLRVVIVSHRTRFPYLGPRHDLHAAARDWLANRGFHDPDGIGLPSDRVFFEETKEAKLARIAALGCTHFIDDLPELLSHPLFPENVRRILFDPRCEHHVMPGIELISSWHDALALFASSQPLRREVRGPSAGSLGELLAAASLPPVLSVTRQPGGGNNRVYRVETTAGARFLKEYFRHLGDPRDRLGAEQAFSKFAWDHGIRTLPQPLGYDQNAGLGLYEFIEGRSLSVGEVTASHVAEAADFLTNLNRRRSDSAARRLPLASEACFVLLEHLFCVDRRMDRLATIKGDSDLHRQAAALVAERLRPAWGEVRAAVAASGTSLDAPLAAAHRVISPSDFGFHNCLATDAGLKFVDFEYAGWDDPAKTVCDFFCQPAVPVPREHFELFLKAAVRASGDSALSDRVALLFPVYEVKWCCIMLNEFLPEGNERRSFARSAQSHESRLTNQLHKVSAALARIEV